MSKSDTPDHAPLVVVGAGPGGYTAAFRAADLGLETVLVERYPDLGGVCLNVGCIPSKALLHVASVLAQVRGLRQAGIDAEPPVLTPETLRAYQERAVRPLTRGLLNLAKRRRVRVIQASARFHDDHHLDLDGPEGESRLAFDQAILAVGSRPRGLPGLDLAHARVMDSTDALTIPALGGSLLVVGGGVIGLEMATVYHALGAEVTVVELTDRLIPEADPDLVRPLRKRLEQEGVTLHLSTRVEEARAEESGVQARLVSDRGAQDARFDRVLVAVGRTPNGDRIQADQAGVRLEANGAILVDDQQRTSASHIFAVGDAVGPPLLAHKAFYEARVAAEVAAGLERRRDARAIPAVAYTDPEVAWVGITEAQARDRGRAVEVGRFAWAANGRALGIGRTDGHTKLVLEPGTGRVLGAGLVGPGAGELVAELALAIELGAVAEDLALTVHPHPTLSETVSQAAEVAIGTSTEVVSPGIRSARSPGEMWRNRSTPGG